MRFLLAALIALATPLAAQEMTDAQREAFRAEVRAYLERALVSEGHSVCAVEDGDTAIIEAAHGDYAVAVIDRMLPGLDGLAVDADLAARGVVETQQQLDQCGLTGTGRPDQRQGIAGWYRYRNVVDTGTAGRVVEAHALEGDFALHRLFQRFAGFIPNVNRLSQQVQDAAGAGHGGRR